MPPSILPAEASHDVAAFTAAALGPARLTRAAERLRETNSPMTAFAFVALDAEELCGTIGFWPIRIGAQKALLLGPLVVADAWRGKGVGLELMTHSLAQTDAAGWDVVLLVGDLDYYARAGFAVAPKAVRMPAPVEAARLLVRGEATLCASLSGAVRPAPDLC